MAEFSQPFDPNEVPEDDRNFEPLPAGDYQMQVIASELKPTKNSRGEMLVLTMEVLTGPHTNRRVWDRLNIRNESSKAQEIAQQKLAKLCKAVGSSGVLRSTEDVERELHFKPFTARLTIQPDRSGEYGPSNAVDYKPRAGQPPAGKAAPATPDRSTGRQTQNAGSAATQPAPQQKAAGARPWAKSA